jgi:hypothetical protein
VRPGNSMAKVSCSGRFRKTLFIVPAFFVKFD